MLNQQINPMLQREIATHLPASSVAAVLSVLQYAEMGNLIPQAELFSDMEERDAHLYAEMNKRKMAVAQLDWSLVAPVSVGARDKKAVNNLEAMVRDNIDVNTLVFDLSDAIGHGFVCLEIEWKQDGGLWLPTKITHRPQRWFTVDIATRREIRIRNYHSFEGDQLIPYGWLVHQHSSKAGLPGTQGLYRALALPYLFKSFALKNWLRFCELYGIPIRVLTHNETDPIKKQELYLSLQSMGQNGVALLQGGMPEDLKTVDMTKGEGQAFKDLVGLAEEGMSKAILGGTLTSSSGKNGNYATAKVHDDIRLQIRNFDAKQIAETLTNQLLGAIITLNGLSINPTWEFDTHEAEDMALYADALPKLVSVGMQIPLSYAQEKMKIPAPEGNEPVLKPVNVSQQVNSPAPNQSGGFMAKLSATPDAQFTPQQQVIEAIDEALLQHLGSPIKTDLVASAIKAATSPEDLERRLGIVLEGADVSEFSAVLEKSLFAADVLGYAHAGQ